MGMLALLWLQLVIEKSHILMLTNAPIPVVLVPKLRDIGVFALRSQHRHR